MSTDDPNSELVTAKWSRPKAAGNKKTCGRDPAAGPGSCRLWWEGCPNAEKAGCYQHWFHQQAQRVDPRRIVT